METLSWKITTVFHTQQTNYKYFSDMILNFKMAIFMDKNIQYNYSQSQKQWILEEPNEIVSSWTPVYVFKCLNIHSHQVTNRFPHGVQEFPKKIRDYYGPIKVSLTVCPTNSDFLFFGKFYVNYDFASKIFEF